MIITIGLSPIPIGILRRAVKEVFLIAPRDASRRIDEVMAGIRERHGIADYRAYAAKSGRIHVIDISILVPEDWDRTVPQLDAIRGKSPPGSSNTPPSTAGSLSPLPPGSSGSEATGLFPVRRAAASAKPELAPNLQGAICLAELEPDERGSLRRKG